MARRLSVVAVGLVASVFVVGDISPSTPWWVGACLLVAGVGIAPALAVMFAMTSASVKFSETAEAYGWIGTGQLIGAALGSAVAGFLIDASAPPARTRRRRVRDRRRARRDRLRAGFPDLRGRDASPIPDTEPVPVIT
jgi:MFS family permease